MKLKADVMPAARADAERRLNEHFNRLASAELHRDQAHRQKRETAADVLSGEPLPEAHPFAQEAVLRGLTVQAFATDIANRPDNVQIREIVRQRLMLRIAAASTPAEIDGILANIQQP